VQLRVGHPWRADRVPRIQEPLWIAAAASTSSIGLSSQRSYRSCSGSPRSRVLASQPLPGGCRSDIRADEAQLETFGPACLPKHPAWAQLTKWWLKHEGGANTPNWDIALSCELEGKSGLILVEAKAHKNELSKQGKKPDADASANSLANHAQITAAIDEACKGLGLLEKQATISCDSHYQLANRLAFTWKLATLGIPTVLIYLGFIGDTGMKDPFLTRTDWEDAFDDYAKPSACRSLFERRLDCGAAPAWLLVRARGILGVSPPAHTEIR
jgi:hypothetical protein